MWYFTWILGLLLACSLGIINVLRLEAQEALAKEHIALDSLTQLLAKESILSRLHEKVENSKRSGAPFSLIYLSLAQFKKTHDLPEHEMDTTLLKVAEIMKQDIRIGIDLASRFDQEDFLLALSGVSLQKAEQIAETIRQDVFAKVRTPCELSVEAAYGIAEYSVHAPEFGAEVQTSEHESTALIEVAKSQCFASATDEKEEKEIQAG